MKQLLFSLVFLVACLGATGQVCVPLAPTGLPGLSPPDDSLNCIERGSFYDETIYLENFDSAFGNFTFVFLRIDSILNVPCGIYWQTSSPNNTFYANETGCISVRGVTNDTAGQYDLELYLTIRAINPAFPDPLDLSDEASGLVATIESLVGGSLGVDLNYILRVIEPGNNCMPLDTTLTSMVAGDSCAAPPELIAEVVEDTIAICPADTAGLSVMVTSGTPPFTFSWSPLIGLIGSASDSLVSVSPTQRTDYVVTITDASGYAEQVQVSVEIDELPQADFTTSAVGLTVNFDGSSSTNTTSWSWNFGDGNNGSGMSPSHDYGTGDMYTVTLTASNQCGDDTDVQVVDLSGVGIEQLDFGKAFSIVNPIKETLHLSAKKQPNTDYQLSVFDVNGKKIYNTAFTYSIDLDVSWLNEGIYFLHIESHDALFIKKLAVE